jgi:hypothetical protein
MRMPKPFIKLPLSFDHEKLAEEIGQFSDDDWRPHPTGFEGNSSLILVSMDGEENDGFKGPMKPSPRLAKRYRAFPADATHAGGLSLAAYGLALFLARSPTHSYSDHHGPESGFLLRYRRSAYGGR